MSLSCGTVILPTAYLPPVQWFVCLMNARKVLIEQYETYPKQTYRNRCEIASANGKLALTIPVVKVNGNHTKTNKIAISDAENWQILHWRALEAAYANSPYFLYYRDELEPFYTGKFNNLLDFDLELIRLILQLTGIEKTLEMTASFELHPAEALDLRHIITPKKPFTLFTLPVYYQVFEDRNGFLPGMSIIDLLFNSGPETRDVLGRVKISNLPV